MAKWRRGYFRLVLGEFFAAAESEIDEALVADGPGRRFRTAEVNGLTEVSMATLGEIMKVGTYDDLVERIDGSSQEAESGEAGLFRLPTEFRDALAGLADIDSAAGRWAATEELSLDHWTEANAAESLRDMAEIARDARMSDRQLLYAWSL